MQAVADGRAAQDYLLGQGDYANRKKHPWPDLLLLDLRLPLLTGLELLAWIREQPSPLKDLRVVVLTSSTEDSDMRRTLELGAVSYLVKPPTAEMVEKVFRPLEGIRLSERGIDGIARAREPSPWAARIFFAAAVAAIVLAAGALVYVMFMK